MKMTVLEMVIRKNTRQCWWRKKTLFPTDKLPLDSTIAVRIQKCTRCLALECWVQI